MRTPFFAAAAIGAIAFFALAPGRTSRLSHTPQTRPTVTSDTLSTVTSDTRPSRTPSPFITVRTHDGLIAGVSTNDGNVHIFKGIPFAAPPVGALRWKAPQPVTPWSGIRKCETFGPSPMQPKPTPFGVYTKEFLIPESPISEDCLYLNVWTAATNPADRRAVLVFIYGGGFVSGGSACPIYDGEAMAKKGVVFVSIAYRVGIFGFLSHPLLTAESGHNASGNYGLMDQIAALRWIKENIAAFGGDPANVTIAGQSAGSMSVSCLVASPLAKGLFTKAIGESAASILNVPGFIQTPTLRQAEQQGEKAAAQLNAPNLKTLRAIPASRLLTIDIPRGPVIDGYVLPSTPGDITRAHRNNPVALLTGWNEDDYFLGSPANAQQFRAHLQQQFGPATDSALLLYPATDDATALISQQHLSRDMLVGIQNYSWANLQSATGRVFVYRFRRRPPATADFVKYGAFHTAEVPYAYGNLAFTNRPWQPIDYQLSATMTSYWANFARTGDPNSAGTNAQPAPSSSGDPNPSRGPAPVLPHWPAYTTSKPMMMILDESPRPKPLPDKAALDFLIRHLTL